VANGRRNGGRHYLADEVRDQRAELTALGKQVAKVDLTAATLLEQYGRDRDAAASHRNAIREEIGAQRAEQQQNTLSIADIQAKLTAISKQLGEHETERQQLVGAGRVIGQIGRMGWVIVGALFAGGVVVVGWISALFTAGLPGK
jgi:chromosome segregation ATPase